MTAIGQATTIQTIFNTLGNVTNGILNTILIITSISLIIISFDVNLEKLILVGKIRGCIDPGWNLVLVVGKGNQL